MRYRPELDGLRGLAIVLVLVAHLTLTVRSPFGHVGVSVFFTLSGYLITSILLTERAAIGGVSIRGFYSRRIRRLAPAFIALLACLAALGLVGVWGPGPWGRTVLAIATYSANWASLEGPFAHLWSLAVEEQFYLVWPLVLIILPIPKLAWVGIGAVVVGAASRAFGGDFGYYATTSYLDVIGIGCAAAIWGGQLSARAAWVALPLVALAVVADSPALAAVGAVLLCVSPARVLVPLGALGRRAYSLYLWDWPCTLLFGAAGIAPTFVAAELSYRLIERRWLRRQAPPGRVRASPALEVIAEATRVG